MRIDKFLVIIRLLKQRTRAKEVCDGGHVKIDGKSAKPSQEVKPGQQIEIVLPRRRLKIRVSGVPTTKSVPKESAASFYEVLEEEVTRDDYGRSDEGFPRGD